VVLNVKCLEKAHMLGFWGVVAKNTCTISHHILFVRTLFKHNMRSNDPIWLKSIVKVDMTIYDLDLVFNYLKKKKLVENIDLKKYVIFALIEIRSSIEYPF